MTNAFSKCYIGGYSTNIGKSKRVLESTIYYKYVFAKPYIRGITTNIGKL